MGNPIITNDIIDTLYSLAESPEDIEKMKALGFVKNSFEDRAGVLTFAERKVNLASLERGFDAYETTLIASISGLVLTAKKKFLADLQSLLERNDVEAIKDLSIDLGGEASKKYAEAMKNMFELGKKTASEEMSVDTPATERDIQGIYRAQALSLEKKIANDLTTLGKDEALYNIVKGVAVSTIIQQTSKALDQKTGKIIRASATAGIGQAFSGGRAVVYERNKEMIYGFQYTAVLDARTTRLCMSLNGRVVSVGSGDFFSFSPPNHIGCRSFWIEILQREFYKPEIEAIPESIDRTRTGYTNFQDLQNVQLYTPKGKLSKDEEIIQREGIIRELITGLREKGVKIKDQ